MTYTYVTTEVLEDLLREQQGIHTHNVYGDPLPVHGKGTELLSTGL